MNKKILLVLGIIFSVHYALADSQSYGPIIQRQSKQIQELKSRILELENTIEEIRINLKKSGVVFCEINEFRKQETIDCFKKETFEYINCIKDMQGKDRVLLAKLRNT